MAAQNKPILFHPSWLYDSRLSAHDIAILLMVEAQAELSQADAMKRFDLDIAQVNVSFENLVRIGLARSFDGSCLNRVSHAGLFKELPPAPPPVDPAQQAADDEAFEPCWKSYPHKKGRSDKKKARKIFGDFSQAKKRGFLAAVKAYDADLSPRDRDYAPGMHRWMAQGKFADFLPNEEAPVDEAEKRIAMVRVFIACGKWDYADGPFPTDEEVEAVRATPRAPKKDLFE